MRIIFVISCPFNACNFESKYLLLKSKIIAKLSRILQKNFCIPNKLKKTAKFNEKRCEHTKAKHKNRRYILHKLKPTFRRTASECQRKCLSLQERLVFKKMSFLKTLIIMKYENNEVIQICAL